MKITALLSRLATAAVLGALLAGCPQGVEPNALPLPPKVLDFAASQTQVAIGTTIKLTWTVQNATEVKIDELKLGSISGVSGNAGEVDVAISGDSLFVLTARNARGASDTAVVSVRVGAGEGELLFTALPSTISVGQRVTLAWAAPGVTSVTLTAVPGGTIDVAAQGAAGSVVVSPTADTVYTLTAGMRSATTSVTVLPTLLSFQASSLTADAGSTVTLSWSTANATRVTLTSPGRPTLVDETDPARVAAGSFDDVLPSQVDPGQLFPYQLTVTGPGATLKDSVVVSVAGSPAVLTFEGPKYSSQTTDAGVTLRWTTRDAASVDLAANGVTIYRAPGTAVGSGSVLLPAPATDTTYLLTATHARGSTASRSLDVEAVTPPTVTLTATPSSIAVGAPVTVSWAGTDVRNVRVSTEGGGTIFRAGDTADTGTLPQTVSFAADQVLRLDVDNGAGETASATAPITVTGPLQFSLPAGSIRAGERVSLSWTSGLEVTGLPHDDVVVRTGSTGFDDISTTGTRVTYSATDGAAKFSPIGFTAPFFGRMVGDEVWIHEDGYVSFTPVGKANYSAVALPSSKLEAYSIAPCWYDTTSVGRWQVKDVPGGNVLIVQWDSEFQVKVFSSGQVDVEFRTSPTTCTGRGVRGPLGDMGFAFPAQAANLGLTLFGPKTSPASLLVTHELPLLATVNAGGATSPVRGSLGTVVRANELWLGEAMVFPSTSVGPQGQWFELYNGRTTPIDLTGWALTTSDGGVGPLSGVIAPGAVLVAGATSDGALNDDAGVQLALPGFQVGLDAGTVGLGRGGNLSTLSWTAASAGVSLVTDFGPFRFSTDTSSSVARSQSCLPTVSFGSAGQLGTPGAPQHCGFTYRLQEMRSGFFDISATGTAGVIPDPAKDDSDFTLSLAGAPFTYFGTSFTSAVVSTNGFLSFDTMPVLSGPGVNQFPDAWPSTTDVNAALVPFGGDLIGRAADANIYYQRVGANVDPAAAAPHWIVQWHHWSHYDSAAGDELDFQVKLFDDGTIEYHFGTMLSVSSTRYAAGINSVTWLENPTGTQALVINTRSYTPGISPNTAFRFTPR